jgi:hypothetical protein
MQWNVSGDGLIIFIVSHMMDIFHTVDENANAQGRGKKGTE